MIDAASELHAPGGACAPRSGPSVGARLAAARLTREIVTRGELLTCRDPEREHAFRRDVQLRAADLAPFLRRMRQIKLEALAR